MISLYHVHPTVLNSLQFAHTLLFANQDDLGVDNEEKEGLICKMYLQNSRLGLCIEQ